MKFKSGLERDFAAKFSLPYETTKIPYVITHVYHPDWLLTDKIVIETKGRWTGSDRTKIKEVIKQSDIQVVMVFQNPHMKLSKNSKTSYADFCKKNDILWFDVKDPELERYVAKTREY